MFTKIRTNEKGFTLIELLIVVAIIGILAAIAIPQFAAYRIRGYNSAALSDLKNIMTGEESYFVDKAKYASVGLTTGPASFAPIGKLSSNVAASTSGIAACYNGKTSHLQGDKLYTFESEEGGVYYTTKTAGTADTGDATAAACNASEYAGTAL